MGFKIENNVLKKYEEEPGVTEVVIPEGVTEIGWRAFYGCKSLTSVTVPEGVTKIGWDAFYGCENLTSITIPESVTEIGDRAFYGCQSLVSITILESVTKIGDRAFSGCKSLTSITIPESVTKIGDGAFYYCQSLVSITIPESITEIGNSAFCGCESLTSVTLPEGITKIGNYAFSDCENLASITIPEGVTEIGNGAFYGCQSLVSITILESVTKIGDRAFSDCKSLTSITIPESVTKIGDGAFSGCKSLTSVTIPESVTKIGEEAFYGCISLTSITIPESVTEIGDRAFYGCISLTSITIPEGVTKIGDRAFYGCGKLTPSAPAENTPERVGNPSPAKKIEADASQTEKAERFALMNVLIKGSAAAIQTALAKVHAAYELKTFGFDPKRVDPADTAIVKAGLVFTTWYEDFITPDEIPFAALPDIKFIGLGNGGDGYRADGSYVFYKDFGETKVSECYNFSPINPQKEEFDAQDDVLENVRNSFMDHPWQYRYMNYSCGEYDPWGFNGKKDKALIAKWKSDEKDTAKKSEKNVVIGGADDVPFCYEQIDGVSPAFYEGIFDGKDFTVSPDETVNVSLNGTDFVLTLKTEKKVNTLLKKFKKALTGKDVGRPLYDPADVASGKYTEGGTNEYGQDLYNVSDDAETLVCAQIAHRASLFAKIHNLLRDKKAAAHIVEVAPKKKNGKLALKRVTQIASLFCMEDDASMYVLCAVAKADTELLIEVRQIATVDMEKTYADVISVSNLFRN